MQLSMGEFKRLRNLGVASGKQQLRSTTIGSDGREWTNEELKRVFNAAKFDRIDELKELIEKGAPGKNEMLKGTCIFPFELIVLHMARRAPHIFPASMAAWIA